MALDEFKMLTFDCYGTLVDWETGIFENLRPLTERVVAGLDRDRILEAHARHESSQQARTPGMKYSDLLAIVYRRLAEEWDSPADWEECVRYGNSVGDWPVFEDTTGALVRLKEKYRLAILSNVDNASFARSNARLGV